MHADGFVGGHARCGRGIGFVLPVKKRRPPLTAGAADVLLEIRREGGDAIVDLPPLAGWHCGWLAL